MVNISINEGLNVLRDDLIVAIEMRDDLGEHVWGNEEVDVGASLSPNVKVGEVLHELFNFGEGGRRPNEGEAIVAHTSAVAEADKGPKKHHETQQRARHSGEDPLGKKKKRKKRIKKQEFN